MTYPTLLAPKQRVLREGSCRVWQQSKSSTEKALLPGIDEIGLSLSKSRRRWVWTSGSTRRSRQRDLSKEAPASGMMLRRLHAHLAAPVAGATELAEEGDSEDNAEPDEPELEIEIEQLHAKFGARLLNVDLEAGLSDGAWEVIQEAFDQYGVLVIPGQGDDLAP